MNQISDEDLAFMTIRYGNASIEEIKNSLQYDHLEDWQIPLLEGLLRHKEEEARIKPVLMYHRRNAPSGKTFKAYEVPELEKKGWVDSPEKLPLTIREKLTKIIIEPIRLVKFLTIHEDKYKTKAKSRTKTALYLLGGLFAFDFLKLFPAEAISPVHQLLIRRIGTAAILAILAISLICLTISYFKKYKHIHMLTDDELDKFNRYY